jgi:asparagine synthase (glutamine-hydrolysing)
MTFADSPFRVEVPYLARMRDTMTHRGPDGAGIWISDDARLGLAHRRLSIIDLSPAAAQPMTNEDGSLWLSFNGEIYNHAEIRRELQVTGQHQFRTDHSDTEVILHAFEQWGIDCLHRFRGMFAIALWDARHKELWLVRDRIGIKPLYYSLHHGRVTFASEIKALLADDDQPRRLNQRALYHYLSFLTTPAPTTLFAGIHKLPAGTWLRIRPTGDMQQHTWWDIWDHADPQHDADETELARELLAHLRTSVRLRKVSDVPVGVFLSGGVDSSTNAVLFAEEERKRLCTFTIGYQGQNSSYPNECRFARQVADQVGAEYHERLLSIDDLINFLPQMAALQDEPLADPVCVPVYFVSELARKNGVIVCQAGEGADELFCGYPEWKRHLQVHHAHQLPVPHLFKRLGLAGLGALGKQDSPYYEWLRRGTRGEAIFWGGAEVFTHEHKARLLAPSVLRELDGISSWEVIAPHYERFRDAAWDKSPLHWMSYLDLKFRLPELLLMRIDKMSMGVGLEARVPFLDHKFVEYVMSIPAQAKLRGGTLKYLLKRSVRGLLDDRLIDRPKQGFGVPIYEWFFDRLGARARTEVDAFCDRTGLFNRTEVDRLFERRCHQHIWSLLNLAIWSNTYLN